MIFDEQNPIAIETLSDLDTALSEGERTKYDHIIRSVKIPVSHFDNHCSWSSESYTRNCILETEKFELILICWEGGQITPIHDHGDEECWVKIIEGEFRETIYKKNDVGDLNSIKSAILKPSDISYMIDFMGFHSLENLSKKRSMSLHLYAKPIRNCRIFDTNLGEFVQKHLVYDTISKVPKKLKKI